MSLSYQPLNPVLVRDPITQVNSQRDYAILKGGNQVTWKKYTTTSISSSAITWSCPPPSGNVFVDRKQYVLLPVRLTFTGTGAATGPLLNANNDAPRAFPLNSSIEVLQASINGQSFSIFISDMIHALTHFNTDIKLHNKDYSLTPCYPDQAQLYSNQIGDIRNPLGTYSNGIHQVDMQRGAFPFTIVQNTPTQAIVDMVICEPLFLSPFFWGSGNASGFYNVTTMDFNLTFLSNANRFWSHNNLSSSNPVTNVQAIFSNFGNTFAFSYPLDSQPLLLFKYITPDETQVLSPNMPITYGYYDVQRYPLDFSTAVNPGITDVTGQISSNNLQLNSIPRMMYIYARTRNQDLYAAGTGCTHTDTYLALENINITFANYSGLLGSADKSQLYQIAAKNGCGMNWTQWSGSSVNPSGSWPVNGSPVKYGTIGSILAIEFATDLGLPSDMAPGLQGQFQLQINAQFKNVSSVAINATLFIIIVSEGTFTIPGLNSATKQLGVITKSDVLNAQTKPSVNYNDVKEASGGNFLSNLKDWGAKLNDFLKQSKIISSVASSIPHPIAQSIGSVASNLGYGYGTREGALKGWETRRERGEGVVIDPSQYNDYGDGVIAGGRKMTRNELKNRLY